MVIRSVMILVAAPWLLMACDKAPPVGDQAAGTAAAGSPVASVAGSKACDVLTQADAATALGREVTKLDASGGVAGLDICQFGYEGERLMDTGHVSVTVMSADIATMRAGVVRENGTIEDVPGIGSGSFYTPEFGLYIGKGNRTAVYTLGKGGEEAPQWKARMIALAKATEGRL